MGQHSSFNSNPFFCLTSPCQGTDLSSFGRCVMNEEGLSFCHGPKSGKSVEGLPDDPSRGCPTMFFLFLFRPVDRSWSRDTTVACFCCCDGADPARTARVPPRGAAASLLEVLLAAPRGGTRRRLVGLKLGSGVGWCEPERSIVATRWSLGAKERP